MKPLEGITVLDFTQFTSGPIITTILADLGADVIKMENPPCGDSNYYNVPSVNKHNSNIASLDHNKRSCFMNARDEKQREILYEMARKADLVVDNFKAGTTKKLGIDFETLRAYNPAIVCCSVSGFGQDGPWAKRAAYDIIVQAVGGLMSMTGETDGRALKCGFSLADIATGASCLAPILAGLYQAKTTGEGCEIDCSMMECAANMLMDQIADCGAGGNPTHLGNEHPRYVPYNMYACRDGRDVMLCVRDDAEFSRFCDALGADGLRQYDTQAQRLANRKTINDAVAALTVSFESEELCARLERAAVCCSPVNNLHEADVSEQLRARRMNNVIVRWDDGTEITAIGCPIKISTMPDGEIRRGPCVGADTIQVVSEYISPEKAHEVFAPVILEAAEKIRERSSKMQ